MTGLELRASDYENAPTERGAFYEWETALLARRRAQAEKEKADRERDLWESDGEYQTPDFPEPRVKTHYCFGCERMDYGELADCFMEGIELAAREQRGYNRALADIARGTSFHKDFVRQIARRGKTE